MPRELKISVGQHSDKGRKETNQDFHGVLIPDEPQLSLKGIAIALADGISSSAVSQVASQVGGQGLSHGLLLHVGILVGEDLGPARAGRDQFLAALADPTQPVFLRPGQGLCLHAERHGAQVDHRAHLPRRRHADLPRRRQRARAADRRSPRRGFLGAELSRPRARHESAARDRLPDASRSRRATSSCWRPTASTSMSATAFIASDDQGRRSDLDRPRRPSSRRRSARQRGQPHGPDRPRRRVADAVPPAKCSRSRPNCRCRRCWRRGRCSTATGSSANCTAAAAATSISPSTSKPTPLVALKIPSIDLRDDPAYLKRFMMEEWIARRIDSPHVLKPCLLQREGATILYVVDRIHRRADADAMDDRQSEARTWKPCAASSSRSPRACAPSTAWRCCTRTSGPTTS